MSDPEEDREFLDDIKALEDVLANEHEPSSSVKRYEDDQSECNLVNNRRGNISSRGFGQVECDDENEGGTSEIHEGQTAYETNVRLIELLKETRRELLSLLERCRENKAILDEKIRLKARLTRGSKVLICTAGMPYFKDGKQYPAPRNNDVYKKLKNGELQVVHLRMTCPWTPKDRNILWRAIRHQAACEVLEREWTAADDVSTDNPDPNGTNQEPDNDSSAITNPGRMGRPLNLPKNFRDMVGPLGSREFDWLKIAVSDFDERHTADECKVMWQVFLHPDINRYRWSTDEDERLKCLIKKYQAANWEAIAAELDSRRSGYQCFLRYKTINRVHCHSDECWSQAEDNKLRRCIENLKVGNYIPWGIVARYTQGRSKAQIYHRYMYTTGPSFKKGRFASEEDERLIEAVKQYGENFNKIAQLCFSDRSGVQLNNHYRTLMLRKRGIENAWSINEDAKLLFLFNEFGPDWCKISQNLGTKTRTQVRHRHRAIVRYWDKGVSLYEIPRKPKKRPVTENVEIDLENDESIENAETNGAAGKNDGTNSEMEAVDLELVRYFRVMPSVSRPGRKRKYYSKDELQDMTRKLCILLKSLGANLEIPEDLDETELSEKEKQLSKSLKDYRTMQIERAKNRPKSYQYVGLDDPEDFGELHFSPVCPGNCNPKKKARKADEKLDYVPPAGLDHCQVQPVMKLDTPGNVLELVGTEKNEDFVKISKFMNFAEIDARRSKFVTKIYVLGPQQSSRILSSVQVEPISQDPVAGIPSTTKVPKKRSRKEKAWNSSSSEGIIQRLDQPVTCIEPNFYTLRALKHVMVTSQDDRRCSRSLGLVAPPSMSNEANEAMKKLKQRLVQLFKYPIGLSHIIKPELPDGATDSQWIDVSPDDTTLDDDECTNVYPSPSKKKRR